MSDLIQALRAAVEFDHARFALARSSSVKSQHDFVDGVEHAHARLKPILEKLIAVVEAAEEIQGRLSDIGAESTATYTWLGKPLSDLRASLGVKHE